MDKTTSLKVDCPFVFKDQEHKHSICIGKKMAYCMDCGQILLEYKNKKQFYNWLQSFESLA